MTEGVHYLVNSEGHRGARAGARDVPAAARHRAGRRRHDAARRGHLPRSRRRTAWRRSRNCARGVTTLAENVTTLAKAPKGEDYSGPVLFEGVAGAQILAEVLGQESGADPASRGRAAAGAAASSRANWKAGRARACCPNPSTWWTIRRRQEWRGRPLFGRYEVDREGVRPEAAALVEKGVLKNFLLTRQPVRGFEGSNGRARLPGSFGAMPRRSATCSCRPSETMPVAD